MRKRNYSGGNRGRGRSNNRGRGNDNQSLARQKKHALTQKEKYLNQARDALTNGDRVTAEYYYQHVEHFSRVVGEIIEKEPKPDMAVEEAGQEADDADASAEASGDDGVTSQEAKGNGVKSLPAKKPRTKQQKSGDIPLPESVLPKANDVDDSTQAASS